MAKAGSSGVFEKSPNAQTVRFGGKFINLSAIARAQGLDVSYLSRIFAGTRTPTLPYCIKIAAMLGMSLDDFVEGLRIRAKEIHEGRVAVIDTHLNRISNEDKKDLDTLRDGKIPVPRLPSLRQKIS